MIWSVWLWLGIKILSSKTPLRSARNGVDFLPMYYSGSLFDLPLKALGSGMKPNDPIFHYTLPDQCDPRKENPFISRNMFPNSVFSSRIRTQVPCEVFGLGICLSREEERWRRSRVVRRCFKFKDMSFRPKCAFKTHESGPTRTNCTENLTTPISRSIVLG